VWLGFHTYFYTNQGLAALTGLEMHIVYPPNETIELHPALPLGFAITWDRTITIIETILQPAVVGKPIGATLAVTFMMGL